MTYTLVALFLTTGVPYVERTGLTLQACAGHAALARSAMLPVLPKLNERIGEVRYLCLPSTVSIQQGVKSYVPSR